MKVQATVQKMMTLADGTTRLFVDIPRELCPDNISTWVFESVYISKEDDENGDRKEGEKQASSAKGKRKNRTE
jgi:hypothetical protein